MDGIDYYGVEFVNIDTGNLGTDSEVFNVQGTTSGSNGFAGVAVTNVNTGVGDDRVYLSSNADLDQSSWSGFDFLTGNLDDFRGALNVDLGTGRHRLFMSDEASSHDDTYAITDSFGDAHNINPAGLDPNADIYITRAGLPGISYKTSGNLYDGVDYWTGSGNDTVVIDGTKPDGASTRTTTILDTGLGNDDITVNLTDGSDGFFVLETSGGSATNDPVAHSLPVGATDDDTVDASGSSLQQVIIGGFGNDTITGGTSSDVILGDLGVVQYVLPGSPDTLVAQFGFGGRSDVIDALLPGSDSPPIYDPRWIYTRAQDFTIGGNDTIYGIGGEDVLIGGAANDAIDGGIDDDLILGDAASLFRRDVVPGPANPAAISNQRFEVLSGGQIYDDTGAALTNGVAQSFRNPDGSYPQWAEYTITLLDHTLAIQTAPDNSFGNDYLAGGPANDVIFGELGDDVIQGDGSINIPAAHMTCRGGTVGSGNWSFADLVGACTDPTTSEINPSANDYAGTDGSDYIEGNGGNDVIFGNQGQDDIVGGSSEFFGLTTGAMRPDGSDMIFGGSGLASDLSRYADGDGSYAHEHDADTIVGDNADIIRLVGTGGAVTTPTFLTFNAVDASAFDEHGNATAFGDRLIPRAVKFLDYSPTGGTSYTSCDPNDPANCTVQAGSMTNIGAGDLIWGENGDDSIYGEGGADTIYGNAGNDSLYGQSGTDWIDGGNGDDGVLGDDGLLLAARNGIAEPLYGLAATTQETLTDGNGVTVTVNVTGNTNYTAVENFPGLPNNMWIGSNDVIYGGLGNDFLHGGSGDDAISGAEALASFYGPNTTNTANNPLGYLGSLGSST